MYSQSYNIGCRAYFRVKQSCDDPIGKSIIYTLAIAVKLTSLQVTVWQYPSQECSQNELALNVCSFPPSWSRGYMPQLKDTRVVCVFPILLNKIGVSGRWHPYTELHNILGILATKQ